MHNYKVTSDPTRAQLKTNLEVLGQAMDDDLYKIWVPASAMTDAALAASAVGTAASTVNNIPYHWLLADAVTSGVNIVIPVHPQWKDGIYFVTVFYGVDGTSAGDIQWRIRSLEYANGDTFGALTSAAPVKAAPTVADTMNKLDLTNSASTAGWMKLTPGEVAIQISIDRLGGNANDTNTDDVRLFGAIVNYKETNHQL